MLLCDGEQSQHDFFLCLQVCRLFAVRLLLGRRLLFSGRSLLGGLLLLGLALALLLASVSGKGLLEDLEDLFVGDLLVTLVLADVQRRGATKLGDTVLGDGWETSC